jgi:putative oxidoreductase
MLYWGWNKVIPAHGAAPFSALHHNAQFVHSLGMPYWLGYVSAITEFLGGICIVVGLLTRFWSILITINMLFAIFLVVLHHGDVMQRLQFPACLAVMALMLATYGAGVAAVDRRIGLD